MRAPMAWRLLLALALLIGAGHPAAAQTTAPADSVAVFLERLRDLVLKGVPHQTVWNVTARAEGKDIAGSASTAFTFKDVGLDQPRVPVVLSVADTIKQEYDFRVVRQ